MGMPMTKKLLWIVFSIALAAQAAAFEATPVVAPILKPLPEQSQTSELAAAVLTRYHYKAIPLDDALSEQIFDRYLKSLDYEKSFFVQGDIDQMASTRTKLDNAIVEKDLARPFAIYNLYMQRVVERFTYARSLLNGKFQFEKNESYRYERAKESWPASEQEMREIWRKRVKNDWLRLKLAGKDEKSIIETLDKRYENSLRRVSRTKSEDAFQVFMNAYTMAIEPHTNYMGSRAAENFDITMRLSLVGIGAVLTEKDDYTIIRELSPGGPAALSGQLKPGDRIIGVAQGETATMTDIQGWRLDDSVALIRGTEDTLVLLDVLPVDAGPDGDHKLVKLIRKKITLENQAAQKTILSVIDKATTRRIGVITIPTFYEDFAARAKGEPGFKSVTRDVARLLDEMKNEKVDGVLVDLRNNGGGSLTEAVELTGLFVGSGPVVQQRNAQGRVTVARDSNAKVVWDGPLGVLINRGSASASEIFAAAIQDYGRGVLIGEGSFGKGTVQSMIDLDRMTKSDKAKFGELKLTIAQFFRIDGGSTQLRGVKPEIFFPALSDPDDFGESSYDNALPWVKIDAANYSPLGNMKALVPELTRRHQARVKNDKAFQALREDAAEVALIRKKNLLSLNETERRKEREAQEAKLAAREKWKAAGAGDRDLAQGKQLGSDAKKDFSDDGLQANERNLKADLAAEKARKDAKDVLLIEAANIVSDQAALLRPVDALVARTKSGLQLPTGQRQAVESGRLGI
jgi:carboxyl-terminal processing protease